MKTKDLQQPPPVRWEQSVPRFAIIRAIVKRKGIMNGKTTDELELELKMIRPANIGKYLIENKKEMIDEGRCFMTYMNTRLKEKGLLKQDVLLRADIPQRYGYKLLTEEKVTKQRDIIIRICYAAEFTLEETQQALTLYRMNLLYPRVARDALIMACFNNRPGSIIEVNELLLKNQMEPLRSSGVQN